MLAHVQGRRVLPSCFYTRLQSFDLSYSPLAGIHETDVAAAAASDARVLKAAVQARDMLACCCRS